MTASTRSSDADARIGWVEQTLAGITGNVERAVFTERHARIPAFLQGVDPRAKLGMFLAFLLAASLTSSYAVLVILYGITLAAAMVPRADVCRNVRRFN